MPPTELDLDRYLERIDHRGAVEPTLETLTALHRGHLANVPFENIDVLLHRPIRLDLEGLQAKLVRRKRGGYCFEHNTLFAAVLRTLGFEVETLEARVGAPGASPPRPRTHMTLTVRAAGRDWLADVGFGADGPLEPVPLSGELSEQGRDAYRIEREESGALVLRGRRRGEWSDLYAYLPIPALPVDFEVANHFTATHPSSSFLETLTVQRSQPEVRRTLRGKVLTIRRGGEETTREIEPGELPGLLERELGLELTEEERAGIRALGAG